MHSALTTLARVLFLAVLIFVIVPAVVMVMA